MALTLENAKAITRKLLKTNIQSHLAMNFDWKVARSVSTGEAISDEEKQYRASKVAEYNRRLQILEAATTVEEVKAISVKF